MRTIIGESNGIVVRQSCLVTDSSGKETLYPTFESLYKQGVGDSVLRMVYCAIDKSTGKPAKGFQPWYENLCQLFKQMQAYAVK